ncbi:TetR/AcrR family transcriptional regulator [Microbaculum marinisediminis]|uniref:TetR family transcriptional regulator n=1 Tax=Microbaculum marinisediminis TaxID=2931392 RepID=A0AAW5QVM3_9HYPH|nr:TetR family transcriptional regulator [Microbaculum sp. A6E488]MCT8970718.1 TetR family transcriptional regulator [Microbaculum sp. A6E488]
MRPSKRDELVRESLKIFYRDGFHATGMDLLSAETGISKTTMFKHFRSKEELILATLRLRDENFRNWLFRRMEEAGPPRAQLLAMFDALKEWFDQPEFRSCMFIKAASEYPDPGHPIHAQAAEHKRLLFRQVEKLAADAGAPDPAALARALLLLKEGAIVTAHIGHEADPAGDAKSAAEILLSAVPA